MSDPSTSESADTELKRAVSVTNNTLSLSPYLHTLYLTSPHLISPNVTSPYLTSQHFLSSKSFLKDTGQSRCSVKLLSVVWTASHMKMICERYDWPAQFYSEVIKYRLLSSDFWRQTPT